jgi:uncharacterized protein (DUF885 family)
MKLRIFLGILSTAPVFVGCTPSQSASLDKESSELQALFDKSWEWEMRDDPLTATSIGDHRFDDRLPSRTSQDFELRKRHWREVLEVLGGIDRDDLSDQDRINYDMFERRASDRLQLLEFKDYLIPITNEVGFHTQFASLASSMPLSTTEGYENYIARLETYPTYSAQNIELMREGMATGFVLPRVVLDGYESTILPHTVDEVTETVFWQPFERIPSTVPTAEHERLRARGESAIRDRVVPAYKEFLTFIQEEYIPGGRETIAAIDLPDGAAYYAFLVRHHTTLDVTAEEVHAVGISEVERIRGEMMEIIDKLEFEGDFDDFLQFLRTDPRFFPTTGEQLLKEASFISKRMDGKLPALFKTLPRQPYGVEPVPAHLAPKYTAGRYSGATISGTRAGEYWVNTYALKSRPMWALVALSLHEAVPGHHLQNALRQELTDLPNFRRFSNINAYGEGWGLYSEWLGIEADMYENPYDDFGRLSYEAWRACRLVVDTGMHALGWTRQQAMEFMTNNTALSLHEITTETDRYISWPGQALAYKMGQIKIQELRRRAEARLGTQFDVREFHDVILLNGPVPLTVLEDQIEAFIDRSGGGSPVS